MLTGKDLIAWGFKPGNSFPQLLARANEMHGMGAAPDSIVDALHKLIVVITPPQQPMRTNSIPFEIFLDAENEHEIANRNAVIEHMDALMRTPVIKAGAVMPDACPSGSAPGTIPVGGVVASTDIHPGMHSADICCSMAITVFKRKDDPKKLLDAVQAVTHFGPGGRSSSNNLVPKDLMSDKVWEENSFLKGLEKWARDHFATQGDGNHFAYVGHLKSTGQLALVTHHGSRGLGAQLYKRGIAVAQKHTAIHAPRVPKHNAWIEADSVAGEEYWAALQYIRNWTKQNHFAIHDLVSRKAGNSVVDRFWNEHNFVFRRTDGLFYHAKGSTPSFFGFAEDDSGLSLIPLNCSEPILIARHRNKDGINGFAPHGAGRNFSRTAHLKGNGLTDELAALQQRGLDIRSYCGIPDLSELPSAYKDAASVKSQIATYDLAEIVDEVIPYGSIMAGDWERDAPWRKKRK